MGDERDVRRGQRLQQGERLRPRAGDDAEVGQAVLVDCRSRMARRMLGEGSTAMTSRDAEGERQRVAAGAGADVEPAVSSGIARSMQHVERRLAGPPRVGDEQARDRRVEVAGRRTSRRRSDLLAVGADALAQAPRARRRSQSSSPHDASSRIRGVVEPREVVRACRRRGSRRRPPPRRRGPGRARSSGPRPRSPRARPRAPRRRGARARGWQPRRRRSRRGRSAGRVVSAAASDRVDHRPGARRAGRRGARGRRRRSGPPRPASSPMRSELDRPSSGRGLTSIRSVAPVDAVLDRGGLVRRAPRPRPRCPAAATASRTCSSSGRPVERREHLGGAEPARPPPRGRAAIHRAVRPSSPAAVSRSRASVPHRATRSRPAARRRSRP